MSHHESEDEFGGNELVPFAYWFCESCGLFVNDWEPGYERVHDD
ncbi:MAG TPA: hypothetical protein VGJ79_00700 [Candidatus Dormibacteraeota bacterium]|jgi:hypothetical protein